MVSSRDPPGHLARTASSAEISGSRCSSLLAGTLADMAHKRIALKTSLELGSKKSLTATADHAHQLCSFLLPRNKTLWEPTPFEKKAPDSKGVGRLQARFGGEGFTCRRSQTRATHGTDLQLPSAAITNHTAAAQVPAPAQKRSGNPRQSRTCSPKQKAPDRRGEGS